MPSFLNLSDELLLHIISFLSPRELLPLAASFNKRIFNVVYPILGEFLRTRRNEKRVLTLFEPDPHSNGSKLSATSNRCPRFRDGSKIMRVFGLAGYAERERERFRLYLRHFSDIPEMDGSLAWLREYRKTCGLTGDALSRSMVTKDQVDSLIDQTTRLGLSLPPVVEKLLRSPDDLCGSLPTTSACSFDLGDRLTKIDLRRSSTHKHEYGYIVSFYGDQQGEGYMNFYFDAKGGFGLVSSFAKFPESENDEEEEEADLDCEDGEKLELADLETEAKLGVQIMDRSNLADLCLEGVDFETWLFRHVDREADAMGDLQQGH
jgi:hypothetical protein